MFFNHLIIHYTLDIYVIEDEFRQLFEEGYRSNFLITEFDNIVHLFFWETYNKHALDEMRIERESPKCTQKM